MITGQFRKIMMLIFLTKYNCLGNYRGWDMGIEDRDWYREKYKNKINRVNDYDPKLFRKDNDLPLKFSKNRTFKYFLFSIFMLVQTT
jgi:hypothetical protein